MTPDKCQDLFNRACAAGDAAVTELIASNGVAPMVVSQHANPLDDNSPVTQRYFVADGPCGFAWVILKPGNSSFAKWAVAQRKSGKSGGKANKAVLLPDGPTYGGGVRFWVSGFNQSMQKKETYAAAFAGVLHASGLNAYSDSRMD